MAVWISKSIWEASGHGLILPERKPFWSHFELNPQVGSLRWRVFETRHDFHSSRISSSRMKSQPQVVLPGRVSLPCSSVQTISGTFHLQPANGLWRVCIVTQSWFAKSNTPARLECRLTDFSDFTQVRPGWMDGQTSVLVSTPVLSELLI